MKEPTGIRYITDQNLTARTRVFRVFVFIFFFLSGFLFPYTLGFCEEHADKFNFLLPAPTGTAYQQYLGISSDKPFSLAEIKAKVVIIEIFSMYCPICQREAEHVNALFRLIQADPGLRDKIKLIGIGAGNSDFEVDFFREKYSIEFPLFSDTGLLIHKKVGEVRTPHFFGLLLEENTNIKVFYSRTGEMSGPEAFLQTIITESGIKEQP